MVIYLIGLLRGLTVLTYVKGLEQGLATASYSVQVQAFYLLFNCLELNTAFQMWSVQRDSDALCLTISFY